MNLIDSKNDKIYLAIIGVVSVLIPVVVALLLFLPQTGNLGDLNVAFLPHLNAVLNSATSIALLAGFYFIKTKNIAFHRTAMFSAFGLSSIFLVSYVIYHFQGTHTTYPDIPSKPIYLIILISHIILATVVVPFVLISIYFAISNQIERHKNIVKYTFPIWLYVAVTGVIVYFMISPFYK